MRLKCDTVEYPRSLRGRLDRGVSGTNEGRILKRDREGKEIENV